MNARRFSAAGLAAASGLAATGLHALPALTSIGPLRNRFTPALAGVGDPGHVALTFDDGPHPMSTPRFLTLLEKLEVRATFFLLGRWVARSPGLAREIAEAGHEIAVHGFDHRCLLLRGPRATYADLARATEVIGAATGTRPRWFRPPYGVLSGATLIAARRLGLTPMLWTAWGEDWTAQASPASVYRTVTADLAGGGTILLHDSDVTSVPGSWRATLGALPRLVGSCRAAGLRIGPLAEHGIPTRPEVPAIPGPQWTAGGQGRRTQGTVDVRLLGPQWTVEARGNAARGAAEVRGAAGGGLAPGGPR